MDKSEKTTAIDLLKKLIATPSFSKEEDQTAQILIAILEENGVQIHRSGNNIWAFNKTFNPDLPTVLLNSHHDTVKPAASYSLDPFLPQIIEGKLYGLGSNDAGGALVSLLTTFLHFHPEENLKYNLLFVASAEEEISGKNGIESVLPQFENIALGIVGEPTLMQMAIAEKGLVVLEGTAYGKSGHAAREEGENALYKALEDIQWIKNHAFEKVSAQLGPVKMTVTQIEAGSQHNVVPDRCHFVVDVRVNECYSNRAIHKIIQENCQSEIKARSFRLNSSSIPAEHPLVQKGIELGLTAYGSPTLSDQALMNFPTLKIGPGDSARSHTADEFIYLHEIEEGINIYTQILNNFLTY
ncbi:MAG TPA: M20 family metallo-hydrolase [Aequorivita sp.]|nr:M20 family metallo-hydrolase [Aequorivita sp.]